MERIPVFMYNKVDGTHDLSFLHKTAFHKDAICLNDNLTGKRFKVTIPFGSFKGYIIVHFNGDDHMMFGMDEQFIRSLMKQKLTKEMMTKFMERGVRQKKTYSYYKKANNNVLKKTSRLILSS